MCSAPSGSLSSSAGVIPAEVVFQESSTSSTFRCAALPPGCAETSRGCSIFLGVEWHGTAPRCLRHPGLSFVRAFRSLLVFVLPSLVCFGELRKSLPANCVVVRSSRQGESSPPNSPSWFRLLSPRDKFSVLLLLLGVAPSKGLCAARSQVLRVVRQVGLRGSIKPRTDLCLSASRRNQIGQSRIENAM